MTTSDPETGVLSWLEGQSKDAPTKPAITPEALTRAGAATPAPIRRLSDLIADIPEDERYLLIEDYTPALLRGDVKAVPVEGKAFKLKYRDRDNTLQRQDHPEELVVVDERFTAWMEKKRTEARRVLMVVTGKISVAETALQDPERVRDLAELRRQHLQRTQKQAGARGAAPRS